jgi:hypothetical protein
MYAPHNMGEYGENTLERCYPGNSGGTGRSAITFERGPRDQINARAKDWIERHDPDELPSGLK